MGELIAVLSGKGGTGKTSVCAGLSIALAAEGKQVLSIDCDVGLRNLDISLGMTDSGTLSFLDVTEGGYSLDQAPRHPDFPTLAFLTAPMNRPIDQVDPKAFWDLIFEARANFDYILLDAPAGVDTGFQLVSSVADRFLLVTGSGPAAIRDAGRTGQLLELMGKNQVKLIVNRINPKLVATMALTVDDVMDDAGLPLIGIVPDDANVVLAAAFGKPLITYTKKGAAAACKRIASRIQGMPVAIPHKKV